MIGVVIPAHNEAALIGECLSSVHAAACHPGLAGEAVEITVVLDSCADGTADVVAMHPVQSLALAARNVGVARAAGASALLARGARWLAFTDADSRVAPDWLVRQLELEADLVCGTVEVNDWSDHRDQAAQLKQHFRRTYNDAEGHRHVHGANLGVSAKAYRSVGGFRPLASSEDLALVQALQASDARIAWSAAPRVVTSARCLARAPDGFAAALRHAVDALLAPALAK
ncbi:MAG: glycosyltransferase family 2 protein [Variovorax sp.]|nr:MAG: glycosyltransferase family 2 protein [Variovorax sp.]